MNRGDGMTVYYSLPKEHQLNAFEYFATNQGGKIYFVFLLAIIILFLGILIAVIIKRKDQHPQRTAKHAMWVGILYLAAIITFEFANKGQTYYTKALKDSVYVDANSIKVTNIALPLGNRLDSGGLISWHNKLLHKTTPLATVQYHDKKLKLQSHNNLGKAFLNVASYAQKQPIDFSKARITMDSLKLNIYGDTVQAEYQLQGRYWIVSANSKNPEKLKIVKKAEKLILIKQRR